ncbi:hypothetical protein EVAR_82669_1 [Eumeta japonica]|uniref:Uncharacterized protein n=1 Tax=Eumeta variegata TaxID=151549 RepID=A0A4C1VDN5_EUMVA|nr:hypothetical protein EVAR_82669_1 [Eumeta japonica]
MRIDRCVLRLTIRLSSASALKFKRGAATGRNKADEERKKKNLLVTRTLRLIRHADFMRPTKGWKGLSGTRNSAAPTPLTYTPLRAPPDPRRAQAPLEARTSIRKKKRKIWPRSRKG